MFMLSEPTDDPLAIPEGDELTLKLSLQQTQALWLWLANNPDKDKYDWPRWTINGGQVLGHGCPCCSYMIAHASDSNKSGCTICPLISIWPDGCMRGDSVLLTWFDSSRNHKTRAKAARVISKAAGKALKRLK